MPESINRRGARRLPLRGRHRFTCRVGTTGLRKNIAKRIVDLSQTGASLIVSQHVEPETEVEITVSSVGRPRPVQAIGTVVRCTPGDEGEHTLCVHFERPLEYGSWLQVT